MSSFVALPAFLARDFAICPAIGNFALPALGGATHVDILDGRRCYFVPHPLEQVGIDVDLVNMRPIGELFWVDPAGCFIVNNAPAVVVNIRPSHYAISSKRHLRHIKRATATSFQIGMGSNAQGKE